VLERYIGGEIAPYATSLATPYEAAMVSGDRFLRLPSRIELVPFPDFTSDTGSNTKVFKPLATPSLSSVIRKRCIKSSQNHLFVYIFPNQNIRKTFKYALIHPVSPPASQTSLQLDPFADNAVVVGNRSIVIEAQPAKFEKNIYVVKKY
jgi:hypothetical protein